MTSFGVPRSTTVLIAIGSVALTLLALCVSASGLQEAFALYETGLHWGGVGIWSALAFGLLGGIVSRSSTITTCCVVACAGTGLLGAQAGVFALVGGSLGPGLIDIGLVLQRRLRRTERERALIAPLLRFGAQACVAVLLLGAEIAFELFSTPASAIEESIGASSRVLEDFGRFCAIPNERLSRYFMSSLELGPKGSALALGLLALAFLRTTLRVHRKVSRQLLLPWLQRFLERSIRGGRTQALFSSLAVTAALSSAGASYALLLPLFAAGLLGTWRGLPILCGIEIGKTLTALLAATVLAPGALALALVHLAYQSLGALLLLSVPPLAGTPRRVATLLARRAASEEQGPRELVFGLAILLVIPVLIVLFGRP